jgi:hypothetical protein
VITEADTCRKYVLPKLYSAGWNDDQISEQKSFTDARIIVIGSKPRRRPAKRADYLLRYAKDFMLAVVEAKPSYKLARDWLQQAKDYAQVLGIKFAYSTNGHGIVEFDYTSGKEREEKKFFDKYGPEARSILTDLLEKYAEHGTAQFVIPDVLKVPPISERGNVIEIARLFGGPDELRQAVAELQALLYAACRNFPRVSHAKSLR